MKSRYVAVLGALVGLVGLHLSAVPPAFAADHEIVMASQAFSPQTMTIKAGDRVRWMNVDNTDHYLTSSGPQSRTVATQVADLEFHQLMSPGSNFYHSFKEPGVYAYFCAIHMGMWGTLVVEP